MLNACYIPKNISDSFIIPKKDIQNPNNNKRVEMASNFYEVDNAELTPSSVQPLSRGAGKKIDPIEFNLNEHTDANERLNIWEDICIRADEFRLWLATRCCACLSSVPSFALVIIAAVLIMLLIATIPLAFALTYISPQASTAEDSSRGNGINILFPDRYHSSFPNDSELIKYRDWDDHISLKTSLLLPKNITSCSIYGFACTGKPHIVIPKNRRCDGYPDCEDGSDELDCHKCQTTLSCQASNNMQTGRKFCLIGAHLCDNQTHCPSGEDETTYCQSECKEGHYKCRDMDMCIPDEAVCDGEEHCPYGDDEENCNGKCKNGAKFCDDKICVSKRKLCDGTADCQDESDEEDCDCASCSGKNSVLCDGNEKLCISKYRVCDGKKDCPGGEDEEGCPGVCPLMDPLTDDIDFVQKKIANNELIRCADGEVYKWKEACNGLNQHCRHSCTKCNPEMAFQCGSETIHRVGNLTIIGAEVNETDIDEKRIPEAKMKIHNTLKECIHRSLVCDRKRDCSDGSDELNCLCGPNSMKCQPHSKHVTTNHCFLDTQKCDGYTDCVGGEDERDCDVCKNGAFHCSSEKRCIPSLARCDGKEDCTDKSDEENCTCEECASHSTKMYMCSGSARCFPLQKVCSPYSMCPNATKMDKLFCAVRGKEYF